MLWVQIPLRQGVLNTLCDKVCQYCDLQQVFGFLWLLRSFATNKTYIIIPPRYSWNIVESSVKHHQTKPNHRCFSWCQLIVLCVIGVKHLIRFHSKTTLLYWRWGKTPLKDAEENQYKEIVKIFHALHALTDEDAQTDNSWESK
jgi:hypothetical protein